MAESYTIEPTDGSHPIDPRALRELRDLLREDDDLDLGVRVRDRPPAPGEQGAIPVALEIAAAATPLGTAFARVLTHWIDRHKGTSVKLHRKGGGGIILSGMNPKDAERLIACWEQGSGAEADDDD
jgi:hypothetical protein